MYRRIIQVEPDLLRIEQCLRIPGIEIGTDVAGPACIYAIVRVRRGSVAYLQGESRIRVPRRFALFLPPGAIVQAVQTLIDEVLGRGYREARRVRKAGWIIIVLAAPASVSRRHTLYPLLLVLALDSGGTLHTQAQPEVQRPHEFVVTGCLTAKTLKTTRSNTFGVSADTFRLRGSKQVMKALSEYEGDELQITGTLRDPAGRMAASRTKSLSAKTKVSIAVREDRNTQSSEDPEVTVHSFKVISTGCR
jgi:hypothetical protein